MTICSLQKPVDELAQLGGSMMDIMHKVKAAADKEKKVNLDAEFDNTQHQTFLRHRQRTTGMDLTSLCLKP